MWSDIWFVAITRIGFWTWIWSTRLCRLGQEMACWFQCWKKSNGFVWSMLKWMGLLFSKNHLLRGWCWISFPNWIGTLTLFLLLKLPLGKLEPWFILWTFFPEAAFYKPTIRPCTEYCRHFWAGTSSFYLEFQDKLQKQICRTVASSFAASLELLAHCGNAASLGHFYSYYFGRSSSETGSSGSTSLFLREIYSLLW